MNKVSESPEQKILECLRNEYPRDLSIEEVAKRTGLHRNTVPKYIWGLETEGKIKISRQVGEQKCTLSLSKHIAQDLSLEDFLAKW